MLAKLKPSPQLLFENCWSDDSRLESSDNDIVLDFLQAGMCIKEMCLKGTYCSKRFNFFVRPSLIAS